MRQDILISSENHILNGLYNIQETGTIDLNSLAKRITFINGRECPHCKSHNVVSRGNYRNRKRYLCNDCGKTYNEFTNTPFARIRDFDKLKLYISCLIKGYSIRKAARIVNISIATSFDWRHRLLDKINELPSDRMKDLREIKEIQIPYSAKGSRKPVSKALSKSKISVVFSGDRAGKLDSDYSFVSDRKSNKILERIRMNLNEHSIIVTNSKSIKRMFENRSFVCYSAKEEYSQDDIITKLVHDWDNWMIRFKGVATKYLHNYLHWFDYLNNSYRKSNQELSFINLLLRHS